MNWKLTWDHLVQYHTFGKLLGRTEQWSLCCEQKQANLICPRGGGPFIHTETSPHSLLLHLRCRNVWNQICMWVNIIPCVNCLQLSLSLLLCMHRFFWWTEKQSQHWKWPTGPVGQAQQSKQSKVGVIRVTDSLLVYLHLFPHSWTPSLYPLEI